MVQVVLATLLLAVTVLAGCRPVSTGPSAPTEAGPSAQSEAGPAAAEPPDSGRDPATEAALLANVRLAYMTNNRFAGGEGPLYASTEGHRPALARILAMLQAAEFRSDPQVRHFPQGVPGGISPRLNVLYTDGTEISISFAFRCTGSGQDPRLCQREPDWVMVDDRPAYAPDLAQYLYTQAYRGDMPPLSLVTVVEPPQAEPRRPRVAPGQWLALQGDGALENPVTLYLRKVGLDIPLGSADAPGGQWTWQGHLPMDLPPGEYDFCPGAKSISCVPWDVVDVNQPVAENRPRISAEQAVEIVRRQLGYVGALRVWFEPEFAYPSKHGETRVRPAWAVQTLTVSRDEMRPHTTSWVDAEIGEELGVRQTEAWAPTPADLGYISIEEAFVTAVAGIRGDFSILTADLIEGWIFTSPLEGERPVPVWRITLEHTNHRGEVEVFGQAYVHAVDNLSLRLDTPSGGHPGQV